MDFNAVFVTTGLQKYKDAFQADGVKYLAGTWTGPTGEAYTSIIVRVPTSQLILELCAEGSLTYDVDEAPPVKLEQRVPSGALTSPAFSATPRRETVTFNASSTVGAYIVSLAINRAVSAKAMAKLEDFYVTGMGASLSHDFAEADVAKKCFLYPGASGHLCFTSRPDSATAGDWKVGDFEDMLNTVHANLLEGHPFCEVDKWFDNHHAIDSQSLDSSKIVSYVNEKRPYHTCATGSVSSSVAATFPPGGSSGLKIIYDPTGWGIQLDATMGTPDDCNTNVEELEEGPFFVNGASGGGGTFNPACTVDDSKCGKGHVAEMII